MNMLVVLNVFGGDNVTEGEIICEEDTRKKVRILEITYPRVIPFLDVEDPKNIRLHGKKYIEIIDKARKEWNRGGVWNGVLFGFGNIGMTYLLVRYIRAE